MGRLWPWSQIRVGKVNRNKHSGLTCVSVSNDEIKFCNIGDQMFLPPQSIPRGELRFKDKKIDFQKIQNDHIFARFC